MTYEHEQNLGKLFARASFDNEERIMHSPPYVRFTCQREMIRDLDRELVLNDGFAYWRTTGRLLVTWYNGNVTAIQTQEIAHNPAVIDFGYDESLPF